MPNHITRKSEGQLARAASMAASEASLKAIASSFIDGLVSMAMTKSTAGILLISFLL